MAINSLPPKCTPFKGVILFLSLLSDFCSGSKLGQKKRLTPFPAYFQKVVLQETAEQLITNALMT